MSNRTSPLALALAFGGCLTLVVCGFILVGGFYFLSNGNLSLPILSLNSAPAAVNRIAYIGNDLNVYIADPTTGDKTALTKEGDSGTTHSFDYPTWSPDNKHLAFVGYTLDNGSIKEGTLYSVAPSGEHLTPLYKTDTFLPFYLYWSPDNQAVGFLTSKDSQQLSLRVARADMPDSMEELDSGSPFYWAWSPDGAQMFEHVGGARTDSGDARLALLPFKQKEALHPLASGPGSFQTPQWSRDGKQLLYSVQDGSGQSVALANAQGENSKTLFNYTGRVSFALSPDGTRVAYIVTPDNVRLPNFGPVTVVDAAGGIPKPISDDDALAFSWSPDSKHLAFLTVSLGTNQSNFEWQLHPPLIASTQPDRLLNQLIGTQQTQQQVQLHWSVWDVDTGRIHQIATFLPTRNFLSLVPYFDQYALSTTFWSPDSHAFLYATRETDTTGSLWVADAVGTTAPHKIGDGLIGFWSWR